MNGFRWHAEPNSSKYWKCLTESLIFFGQLSGAMDKSVTQDSEIHLIESQTPTSRGYASKNAEFLTTPSTVDFGPSANGVDCSTDSVILSDSAEMFHHGDIYSSFFDKPEAAVDGEVIQPVSGGERWSELNSATAALLDPSVLRMFVDSLTRSIGNPDPPSILGNESDTSTPVATAPQVATPSSQGSGVAPPPFTSDDRFRRSVTNMSVVSNQTGYDPTGGVSSTVMLRNVPYDARQRGVLSLLEEEGFGGSFDFFYAPLDFKSKNNLGYAFVNFKTLEIAKDFFNRFDGKKVVSRPGWDKPLRVCWARVQGLEANIEHYRNSPVNDMPSEFKPMLFDEDGLTVPFPAPDALRDESRRSAHAVRPRERRLQSQLSKGFLTPVNSGPSMNSFSLTKTPAAPNSGSRKLFVGGLGPETTSEQLEEYLSRFGRIQDCHVLIDAQTGRSRCYGFCTFSDEEGAQEALRYPKTHMVEGRGVVVRPYTSSQRT